MDRTDRTRTAKRHRLQVRKTVKETIETEQTRQKCQDRPAGAEQAGDCRQGWMENESRKSLDRTARTRILKIKQEDKRGQPGMKGWWMDGQNRTGLKIQKSLDKIVQAEYLAQD